MRVGHVCFEHFSIYGLFLGSGSGLEGPVSADIASVARVLGACQGLRAVYFAVVWKLCFLG